MFRGLVLGFNRLLIRCRKPRAPAGGVLLLIPHCLQRSKCKRNIISDIDECSRCGQCNIAELIALRDELGVQCHLVGGGQEAIRRSRDPSVKVIVAVACEKELAEGIRATFPKPVVAVRNLQPEGPCKNTRVDVEPVRQAILEIITPAGAAKG